MTDTAPQEPRAPRFESGHEEEGKVAAVIAWAMFILSIPSVWILVLVGLVVAYAGRGSATGLARAHIDSQIALFWSVFLWGAIAIIGVLISIPLMVIGIGFLTIILFGIMWFLISVWFTVKSVLGLLNLLGGRAP